MPERGPEQTALTQKEWELISKIAERDGVTEDEAATRLIAEALARRVRRRTGHGPAKVYGLKKR